NIEGDNKGDTYEHSEKLISFEIFEESMPFKLSEKPTFYLNYETSDNISISS
ncbi:10283_t:CDS:1, partial [Racocetra persica]